jgi:hypothetical protein
MSNGNSFSNGDSMSTVETTNTEPWWFRVMRLIQDCGPV